MESLSAGAVHKKGGGRLNNRGHLSWWRWRLEIKSVKYILIKGVEGRMLFKSWVVVAGGKLHCRPEPFPVLHFSTSFTLCIAFNYAHKFNWANSYQNFANYTLANPDYEHQLMTEIHKYSQISPNFLACARFKAFHQSTQESPSKAYKLPTKGVNPITRDNLED